MPIYTCTIAESTLQRRHKARIGQRDRAYSFIPDHVPSTYVNVAFHELAADGLYAGGGAASPVLVTGWVREGHPDDDTTRLATEISTAVTRISEIEWKSSCRHPTQPSAFRRGRWPCPA